MKLSVFLAFAFVLLTAPAHAALKLCNQTSYILYAATAHVASPNVVSQGWTRVVPGACETAIAGALIAPAYYVYAHTSQAHSGRARIWGGGEEFCVRPGNFKLTRETGLQACGDDSFSGSFGKIDMRGKQNWITTFTESAKINSPAAAREAGIARLLGDNGYKGEGALAKFRARMKLPENAGNDALFDALETGAMKQAAPAGYSICNDSQSAIWAALGMKSANGWLTRGWWKVEPGACAHAITDPLSADTIYLHAEGHGDHHLVTGKTQFCVTDITFEVSGKGDCAGQGLTSTGFAATDTHGRAGYAAHIGQNGLLPAMGKR